MDGSIQKFVCFMWKNYARSCSTYTPTPDTHVDNNSQIVWKWNVLFILELLNGCILLWTLVSKFTNEAFSNKYIFLKFIQSVALIPIEVFLGIFSVYTKKNK